MINNVPINGYVYQYIGDKKAHVHKIEVDNLNERRYLSGYTTYTLRHRHSYSGLTEPGFTHDREHTHRYFLFTSTENGHKHIITGITGPAIYLPDGEHYHILRGVTSEDGSIPHVHRYLGRTLV